MISLADLYAVFTAMVPLYVAMFLAYASVKRWEIFTPEQCSGINRFVATFAIPFLAFNIISSTDPYKINLKFILADTMQKLLILFVLILWAKFTRWGSFNWMITLFSLSIMPNTLIIGIPLLRPMYGEECIGLLVQVVVLQLVVWCPIFLCLYELHAAKVTMNGKVRFTNDTNEGKEGDEMMNVEVIFKKKNTPADECPVGDLAHSNEREVQGEVTHPRMTTTNLFLSVLSKVMKNPNTYGSVLGLIWGLISFRSFYGISTQDNSMWEKEGYLKHGCEIYILIYCNGYVFYCNWHTGHCTEDCYNTGGASARSDYFCVC
ncbi:auxin efflux carrier component 7 isoform X3 [Amborella trichopoda]|uniref:auxin efflux carrier component 7 isoform X3 n=1 Tax=Amborella trichopoda TaxID=13333 RepID=UPI0009BD6321|nr:auxin efflux carrier component 7 isoform X3 [Amborella trichopoda]|eukprot:XP_020528336.1 auxin efflux carrier component 7 isoform X3 [Amborella trichopoda]